MDYEALAAKSADVPLLGASTGAEVVVNGVKVPISKGEALILQVLGGLEQRVTGAANEVVAIKGLVTALTERLASPKNRPCANCGRQMPENLSLGAKYCTDSCKQSAYLDRKAKRDGEA